MVLERAALSVRAALETTLMSVPVAEVLPSMVSEGLPSGLRMLLIPESEAAMLEVDLGPNFGSTPEATDVEGSGGSMAGAWHSSRHSPLSKFGRAA